MPTECREGVRVMQFEGQLDELSDVCDQELSRIFGALRI